MKKILLVTVLGVSGLFAESLTFVPYGANIKYDNSSKKNGTLFGSYLGYGDLSYYLEADISTTNIKYVDNNLSNLKQNNYLLTYASYGYETMFKGGIHYIDTTDTNLGNGIVYIGAIENYFWTNYDKFKIGTELYFSDYQTGSENALKQITPYMGFKKALTYEASNNFVFKVNYIQASDSYLSYDFEDSFQFRNFSATLKYFTGKMKSGVKESGATVFNTEDLLLNGTSIKLTNQFTPSLSANISYGTNTFKEVLATKESTNKVISGSVVYSF